MYARTVRLGSRLGLHARPAALIAAAASELSSTVLVGLVDGEDVAADSALMLMTMGASYGDTVRVLGDDDADVAIVAAMVASDLDEA